MRKRPTGRFSMKPSGSSEPIGSRTSPKSFRFVERAAAVAEAEGHHPDIGFGWGYARVSLHTKKIKGLHENDFIMAAKLDRIAAEIAS